MPGVRGTFSPPGVGLALALGPILLAGALAGATWWQPAVVLAGGGSANPCTAVTVSSSATQPVAPGSAITVTALAQCPAVAQYAFFMAPDPPAGGSPQWTLERGWGAGTFTLSTSADMADGGYQLLAWATDGAATTPQVQASAPFSLVWPGACTTLTTTLSSPQGLAGSSATLQATATCGSAAQYAYFVATAPAAGAAPDWQLVQGWTPAGTFQYQTQDWLPGNYWLLAWATDGPQADPQVQQYSVYTVTAPPPCGSATVASSLPSGVIGDPVTLTATATCPAGSQVAYTFWYQPQGASSWTLAQGWTYSPAFIYDTYGWPAGTYSLMAWASSSWGVSQGIQGQASFTLASSGGFTVSGISTYERQIYGEDCEEASLQMALEHESIFTSQQQILNLETVNSGVPGIGPGINGDPYQSFVGPVNGADTNSYEPGTYFPTVARAAVDLGANVIADGRGISPAQLYTYIEENHSVVAWVTTDFEYHPAIIIGANGDQFPWAGGVEHAVMVIGVGANSVLIWNPEPTPRAGLAYTGEQWVPMSRFQAAYATYGDMAVVLN